MFLCEQCAGTHRSLGPHISKVKSLTLDNWDSAQIHVSIISSGQVFKVTGASWASISQDMSQQSIEEFEKLGEITGADIL